MNKFGGEWTKQKLDVLEDYFNFYMTALKNMPFKKIYIDCFAGSGEIEFSDETKIDGSTIMALNLDNKFDEYHFIEKDRKNFLELEKLKEKFPELKIYTYNEDCNEVLPKIISKIDWRYSRGILFIDPYATQLDFNTLKNVSKTKAIDVWYLFPFHAINRMLKKDKNINNEWKKVLNRCLGDDTWEDDLYFENTQLNVFQNIEYEKVSLKDVQKFICKKMKEVFPYVSENYLVLKNSRNSPLFLLFLLISNDNPKAIGLVKKVEKYILKDKTMV